MKSRDCHWFSDACLFEIYKRLITVSPDSKQMIGMGGCSPQVVIVSDRVTVGMSVLVEDEESLNFFRALKVF